MRRPVVVCADDPAGLEAASVESLRRLRPLLLVRGGRSTPSTLVTASATAALVVLGASSPSPGRACTGLAVAGAALCPVLVVPRPDPVGRPRRDVVVGVSARPGSRAADTLLLHTALAAATARGTGVLAVHAWSDTGLEPDRHSTPGEVDWGLLLPDEHRTLAEVLAGCAEDWPDVPLRQAVVRAPLGPTLLATALSAQLLVLGTHRRHARGAVRLVLHRPPCPVELVPTGTRTPNAHLQPRVLEDHR